MSPASPDGFRPKATDAAGDPDRLSAERVANMAANGVAGALSGLFGAVFVAAVLTLLFAAPAGGVLAWLLPLAAAYGAHLWLCLAWRRGRSDPVRGCRHFAAVGFVEGTVWGVGIVAFAADGTIERELFLILMGAGVAGAIGLSFGAYLPAFFARFLPATLPYIAWALGAAPGHAALHRALAVAVAAFIVSNAQLARGFNASFTGVQRARFREHDLAAAFRVQKDAAEAATLAKSRFLAAASHDLRQPVHTLRLFVAALRAARLDGENAALLGQIEAGVARIDALFAGLLDLSQLESGRIVPRPAPFPLAPLLLAVCRDHADMAARQGLRLRVVPTGLTVDTDRVLLERMLRNLVGNALRYTEVGGVLVGARRRGTAVSVEVWDTGPGIAAEEQRAIFEEFHQIDRPGMEREQGLGLGLAIVERLSALLGVEVTLRSWVGAGTCFALRVPGVLIEKSLLF